MEHTRVDDERGRSGRFDGSGRREMRVIGGGEGTQGSKEGGGSEQDEDMDANRRGRTATPPTGRRSGRASVTLQYLWCHEQSDNCQYERKYLCCNEANQS